MNYEQEQQFAAEVKRYVTEHLPLSQISDSELQQQIEDIVEQRIGAGYCSIEQRVSIVEQVYSSIRGFRCSRARQCSGMDTKTKRWRFYTRILWEYSIGRRSSLKRVISRRIRRENEIYTR